MADAGFLLDTNICIYAIELLSEPLVAKLADQPSGSLFFSSISFAEVSVGYSRAGGEAEGFPGFLEEVRLVSFDEAAARCYGTLPFKRRSFDRLIAAHALSLGFTLVTNNEADFADVPGLKVENWTRP